MSEEKWELIIEVSGELQADILRNLLEVQGIKVFLNQEGAGRAYGLTVGPMGQVQVLVPEHQSREAHQIVEDYYAGKFESDEGEYSDLDENTQG
ncbi:MAG TPA: DUF2007 domain-containing protein [Anaerolineales bacterium]|jgi:hypothetical protein|nr:DUF2007 domain-containing protein [Anaerolineales bacterium]